MKTVAVGAIEIANDKPLVLVAGPCAMESRAHAFEMADALTGLCAGLGIGLIYKSSFDKGNRTSMVPLSDMPALLRQLKAFDALAKEPVLS